jgi:hypothetical protein
MRADENEEKWESGFFCFFLLFIFPVLHKISQIIGIDLIQETGYHNQQSAFLKHISGVRTVIGSCPLFLSVEQNMGGHVAMQHYQWLLQSNMVADTCLLKEYTQKGLPGILTDSKLKTSMTSEFKKALADQLIRVYAGTIGQNVAADLKELRNQLGRFSYWPLKSKVPGRSTRVPVSGKGANNNMNDDGAMALLICYAMYIMLTSGIGTAKYGTDSLILTDPIPRHDYQPIRMLAD